MSSPTPRSRRLAEQEHAAHYSKRSTRTIRRWIGLGYITGYRVAPGRILVDLDELDAQLRAMPAAKMSDGRKPYGPDAKIVDLVLPVQESGR